MSYCCFSSVVIEAKVSADKEIKRNSENYDLNYLMSTKSVIIRCSPKVKFDLLIEFSDGKVGVFATDVMNGGQIPFYGTNEMKKNIYVKNMKSINDQICLTPDLVFPILIECI